MMSIVGYYLGMDQLSWISLLVYILLIFTDVSHCDNYNENPTKVRADLGNWRSKGKLELFYNGHWGAVCARRWGRREAAVACRMLGFNGTSVRPSTAYVYQHQSRLERTVHVIDSCEGTELSLDECGPIGRKYLCGYAPGHFLVGIDCEPERDNLIVELLSSSLGSNGIVLIGYPSHRLGSICGATWGAAEAQVACKQLGYTGQDAIALEVTRDLSTWHRFSDVINLVGADCEGWEHDLGQCVHQPVGDGTCEEGRGKAGVSCTAGSAFEISLRDGVDNAEGWVYLSISGIYRPSLVVHEEWTGIEATVICRMKGFQWGASGLKQAENSMGYAWRFYGNCNGDESSLLQCNITKWRLDLYSRRNATYVKCYNGSGPSIPVVNGLSDTFREQENVTVTCAVNGGDNDVTVALQCPGASISSNGPLRVRSGRDVSVSANLKGSHAVLNEKPCICTAVNAKGWFAKTESWAKVIFGPTGVRVIKPKVAPKHGEVFTLVCEVEVSNPASEIEWYNGTQRIMGAGRTYSKTHGNMSHRTYNHWYILAEQSMTGSIVTCLARNPITNQTSHDSQVLMIGTDLPDVANIGLTSSNIHSSSFLSFLRSYFKPTFGSRP